MNMFSLPSSRDGDFRVGQEIASAGFILQILRARRCGEEPSVFVEVMMAIVCGSS